VLAAGACPWIVPGDGAPLDDGECGELKRSPYRVRKGPGVGGSPRIAAGDDAPVGDTKCNELKCSLDRLPQG